MQESLTNKQGLVLEIERSSNLLSLNLLFKFVLQQRELHNLVIWFFYFDVPLSIRRSMGWSKIKAHYNNKKIRICNCGSNNMKLFFNFDGVISNK